MMPHPPPDARRPHWSRRNTAAAFAALGLFWIAAASTWQLAESVVPWDSKNHFYPMLRYLGSSIAQGEWPLWNPFHFGGHPTAADPQSLLFTPTMLAFAALVPDASMQTFDVAVLAHLLLAGTAALLFFRRKNLHPAGAVLAGMMIVLGGSASARLQHTGIIISYAFFVPALLMLDVALEKRCWRWTAGFAATGALMAVGRDQIAFLFTLALIGYVFAAAASQERPMRWLANRLPLLAVAGLMSALLVAVPALLTLQLLADSNRPAISFGYAAMGSLVPSSIATMLAPDIFGTLDPANVYWGPMWDTIPEGTWTDRSTGYLFAGTLPVAILLWEGLARKRILDREIRYFAVLAAAAFVYALGRYTPVFELVFDHLPGVKLYRRPADATFVINVAIAFLAGYGLSRFVAERDAEGARFSPAGAMLAVLIPALAVGSALAFSAEMDRLARAIWPATAALVAIAAAFAVLDRAGTTRMRVAAAVAAVTITGGEILWRNAASSLNAEPATRYSVYDRLTPAELAGLSVLRQELAARHAEGSRPRVEIVGLSGAWQNAAMVFGIEDTVGYNALRLADYQRLVGVGENAVETRLRTFPGTFRGYGCRMAKLLGLEYLVLGKPVESLPEHFPRPRRADLLYGAEGIYVYRLRAASPRAYFASALRRGEIEKAIEDDELPEFDGSREALIDPADLPRLSGRVPLVEDEEEAGATDRRTAAARVGIERYGRNRVVLSVETDRPGVVVLHDLHYPGWTVSVNDVPAQLLKVNMLFRGVEVRAGRHEVVFSFEPLAVANLAAAASGLFSLAAPGAADDR
jgi:hypothetical protein